MDALFIRVELEQSASEDAELARKLEEACPVDIYAERDARTTLVDENLDECILCGMCVEAAPPGAVRVVKLYDGTALER